jgi:UDP-N-acetyl-D-mannosaminuronic acid dehydrogenase
VSEIPEPADAFIIAVPTPFFDEERGTYNGQSYRLADMRAVKAASEAIVPYLQRENLVVLESTSPPRTTIDTVQPILERTGSAGGLHLAYTRKVLPGKLSN